MFEIWLIKRFPFVEWLAHVLRFPPFFSHSTPSNVAVQTKLLIVSLRREIGVRGLGGAGKLLIFINFSFAKIRRK